MDKLNNICKDQVINFLAHIPKNYNTKKNYFYIYLNLIVLKQ